MDTTFLPLLEDNTASILRGHGANGCAGYFVARRRRGTITSGWPPATTAELWISDDSEPSTRNNVRRAYVVAPRPGRRRNPGAAIRPRRTSVHRGSHSTAGQKYYYEVLHNVGATAARRKTSRSAGCSMRPVRQPRRRLPAGRAAGNNAAIGGSVLAGYPLETYDYPATSSSDGSTGLFYVTNLSPQGAATLAAPTGSANLRDQVTSDTQAILHFNYTGLSPLHARLTISTSRPDARRVLDPSSIDLDDVDKISSRNSSRRRWWLRLEHRGSGRLCPRRTSSPRCNRGFAVFQRSHGQFSQRAKSAVFSRDRQRFARPRPLAVSLTLDTRMTAASDAGAARFLNQAAFGAAPDGRGDTSKRTDTRRGSTAQMAMTATQLYRRCHRAIR